MGHLSYYKINFAHIVNKIHGSPNQVADEFFLKKNTNHKVKLIGNDRSSKPFY